MVRLHAGDHVERGEAREVVGRDVLRVLDARPPVAGAVALAEARQPIEMQADGAVADRMHDEMQSSGIGAVAPRVERVGIGHEQTAIARRIVERLEHRGGARA